MANETAQKPRIFAAKSQIGDEYYSNKGKVDGDRRSHGAWLFWSPVATYPFLEAVPICAIYFDLRVTST